MRIWHSFWSLVYLYVYFTLNPLNFLSCYFFGFHQQFLFSPFFFFFHRLPESKYQVVHYQTHSCYGKHASQVRSLYPSVLLIIFLDQHTGMTVHVLSKSCHMGLIESTTSTRSRVTNLGWGWYDVTNRSRGVAETGMWHRITRDWDLSLWIRY